MAFDRQRDVCPPEQLPPVTLIGAGGIGSRTAEALVAIGVPELIIYDHDTVEDVNLGPQFFYPDQLGAPKVRALLDNLPELNTAVRVRETRYSAQLIDTPVVVLALDSLQERARIWRVICERYADKIELVVDGRMGWDALRVYFVLMRDNDTRREYAKSLRRPPLDLPCTARAVAYNVFNIASIIAAGIKSFALEQPLPKCIFWDFKEWFVNVTD